MRYLTYSRPSTYVRAQTSRQTTWSWPALYSIKVAKVVEPSQGTRKD